MKNCTNCGKKNLDEAVFCAACGTPLPAAEAQQPVTETEHAPEVRQEPAVIEAPVTVLPADSSSYSATAATAMPAESNKATLWLILNIVITVLCCSIFGIVGIVFAAIGMGSYNKGDYEDMKNKSKIAMIMFIVGAVVGVLMIILSFAGLFALPFIGVLRSVVPY